ncbi:MAG: WXG100 family type VII secretion target [Stackebrandtia sp.]
MNDNTMIAEANHSATTGLTPFESGMAIAEAIDSESWVDYALKGAGFEATLLSAATDPLGTLAAIGVNWLMEVVEPLREILDAITGDPDEVDSHAVTWDNVAAQVEAAGSDLSAAVTSDISAWTGDAAEAYGVHVGDNIAGVYGLAASATAMASATRGAGAYVEKVRVLVRGLIASCVGDLVGRVPRWLAEEAATLGGATPAVVAEAAAVVAKYMGPIVQAVDAMVTSVRSLITMIEGLCEVDGVLDCAEGRLNRPALPA